MRDLIYIATILGIVMLTSCSTNRDLVGLEEYDDLYYTPTERVQSEPVAYESGELEGASSAESRYYGESPFVDEQEKPSSNIEGKSSEAEEGEFEDYYDPDYARRIENFHRSDSTDYVYSDAYANNMNMNMQPRVNVGFGMNSFNGFNRWGIGMSIGSPWMGNRWPGMWCDPFWDPWCDPWMQPGFGMGMGWGNPWMGPRWGMGMGWGATWGMYDPFSPWYNPYMGWNNPWGWNPWYGPGVIIVDGSGSGNGYRNTTRNQSSRISRGGIVGSGGSERTRMGGDDVKNNTSPDKRTRSVNKGGDIRRSRPISDGNTDYYNRTESQRYRQDVQRNTDYRQRTRTRPSNNRVISPYTRQQQSGGSRSNNYYRPTSRPSYSSPTRRSSGGSNFSRPSSPSRNFSSPSVSPSRMPSSSPSRGGGGSRRR